MASDTDAKDNGSDATPSGHQKAPNASRASHVRDMLSVLDADQRALTERIRTPVWYYPLLALSTALIVGSPGAGLQGQFLLVILGSVGIVMLSLGYQRATGVTVTRTAGPKSRTVVVLLGITILLLLAVSFTLALAGHPLWTWATSAAAFAAMWTGGRLYDHTYSRELRRGQ